MLVKIFVFIPNNLVRTFVHTVLKPTELTVILINGWLQKIAQPRPKIVTCTSVDVPATRYGISYIFFGIITSLPTSTSTFSWIFSASMSPLLRISTVRPRPSLTKIANFSIGSVSFIRLLLLTCKDVELFTFITIRIKNNP